MKNIPFISIPAIGTVAAYAVDPLNRVHVASLIQRADAYFTLSRKAWLRANKCGGNAEKYQALCAEEQATADNGAALLAPLGVKVDWPGLYPSFTVKGYGEHTTKAAVLAALDHPLNWLPLD
jgi:hypothetical protein